MTEREPGTIDFDAHNAMVERIWERYNAGDPERVPMQFGINPRYTAFNHPANPRNTSFAEYSTDPDVMIERQIEHQAWVCTHIPQDTKMGLPKDGWSVYVDFQNYYEAGWYGAEVKYYDGQVPDTSPPLRDDSRKWSLIEKGMPDPFTGGTAARMWDYYAHMKRRMEEGREYDGLPIAHVMPSAGGTDGPMTVCCNLRGASEFVIDMIEDPEYADAMLSFVTEAAIARIKAYRERYGEDPRPERGGLADDSIQLIGTPMYRERVLPHHRRILDELHGGGPHGIHLCGDATRHFPLIRDELNVWSFDTGFPVDFTALRNDLGPDVEIRGGPDVPFLETAAPDEVYERTRQILGSGIMEGGKFILREGNNLSPGVPLNNLWAMCNAVHDHGTY